MPIQTAFSSIYRFFACRRLALFLVTAAVLAGALLAIGRVQPEEDIAAMLPDDGSAAAEDFHLLQQAPWTRKVVISLRREAETGPETLLAAVDRLATTLPGGRIERVVTGPADLAGNDVFSLLGSALPNLATAADLDRLAAELGPAQVRRRLEEGQARLLSPEGWGMQALLRGDPLDLRLLGLAKLRHLNMVPAAQLETGRFLSPDGRSAMLLVDTSVDLTDSGGGRELAAQMERGRTELPAGIGMTWVSGHRYTLANADAIKRDLLLVLSLSGFAVLAVYLFYLRSRWAFFVFLVPSSVLLLATGALALLAGERVFAITLGFGGVLLGIADEYAMQIYFGLRRGAGDPATIVGEVSRPVLFSGLATLATFAIMLLSALPGQRQLALFAMIGIAASLLISLIVLPHLVPPAPKAEENKPAADRIPRRIRLPRRIVLAGWLLLLAVCGWQAGKLKFDGDLRTMNLVPPEIRQAEKELQQTWGNLRGRAVAFVEGKDLQAALTANDQLFTYLAARLPAGDIVSLAPIFPSAAVQASNRQGWNEFWGGNRGQSILQALQTEAAPLGFAPDAFAPFLQQLSAAPPVIDAEGLRRAGLGEALTALVIEEKDRVRLLTLLPDTAEVAALFAAAPDGAHLVSQAQFGITISRAVERDFARYLLVTSLVVTLLVAALFRKPTKILLTLVPAVTGLTVMTGIMGALGIAFNLFNIVATVLVLGLCVDYGIYIVCRVTEGTDHAADRAVLVSGLTTLAGFGILVLARHPALHSIGITVLLGIGAAIPAALLVIPALRPERVE